jgi:Ca-activated chloride channel family protein
VAAGLGLGVLLACLGPPATAQDREDPPALLLILDASGSMQAKLGRETRMAAAKQAVRDLVAALPSDSRVGLRVYGHRAPNTDKRRGCADTQLVAPVVSLDRERLRRKVNAISPRGFTPIAASLRQGLRDLPRRGARTMILVSDGIETCAPPPPCEVARSVRKAGARVDVVGFRVGSAARRQLRCIAREGGGSYVDARSAAQLAERLRRISLRPFRTFEVKGTKVAGSDVAREAPRIGPGTWADTIGPGGDRWYAVAVEEGQSLSASATIGSSPASEATPLGLFAVRMYGTDLFSPTAARGAAEFNGLTPVSAGATSPVVGTEDGFERDGNYLVRVTLSDAPGLSGRFPVQLELAVEGDPVADPAPEEPSNAGWILLTALAALAGCVVGALVVRTVRRVVAA